MSEVIGNSFNKYLHAYSRPGSILSAGDVAVSKADKSLPLTEPDGKSRLSIKQFIEKEIKIIVCSCRRLPLKRVRMFLINGYVPKKQDFGFLKVLRAELSAVPAQRRIPKEQHIPGLD